MNRGSGDCQANAVLEDGIPPDLNPMPPSHDWVRRSGRSSKRIVEELPISYSGKNSDVDQGAVGKKGRQGRPGKTKEPTGAAQPRLGKPLSAATTKKKRAHADLVQDDEELEQEALGEGQLVQERKPRRGRQSHDAAAVVGGGGGGEEVQPLAKRRPGRPPGKAKKTPADSGADGGKEKVQPAGEQDEVREGGDKEMQLQAKRRRGRPPGKPKKASTDLDANGVEKKEQPLGKQRKGKDGGEGVALVLIEHGRSRPSGKANKARTNADADEGESDADHHLDTFSSDGQESMGARGALAAVPLSDAGPSAHRDGKADKPAGEWEHVSGQKLGAERPEAPPAATQEGATPAGGWRQGPGSRTREGINLLAGLPNDQMGCVWFSCRV